MSQQHRKYRRLQCGRHPVPSKLPPVIRDSHVRVWYDFAVSTEFRRHITNENAVKANNNLLVTLKHHTLHWNTHAVTARHGHRHNTLGLSLRAVENEWH